MNDNPLFFDQQAEPTAQPTASSECHEPVQHFPEEHPVDAAPINEWSEAVAQEEATPEASAVIPPQATPAQPYVPAQPVTAPTFIPPMQPYAMPYQPHVMQPAVQPAPQPEKKEPKKKRLWWRIALIAVCCALVGSVVGGAAVGMYFSNRDSGTEPPPVTSSGETVVQHTMTPSVTQVAVDGEQMALTQLYQSAVPSIVGITNEYTTTSYFGQPGTATSTGTGFIITSDGEILTNYHVVEKADRLTVALSDGTEHEATLLGYEAESDVALIKINVSGLTPVTLGDSDALYVGEQIAAIGNPLGELTYTMTVGYVSAKGRAVYTDEKPINMMQIDAAINPGNSGGPLYNLYGQVIGITTAKYSGYLTSSTTIEGIGFAIPINDVLSILDDLRQYGTVQNRAYIGVTVTSAIAEDDSPAGALVNSVEEGSCGEEAGLRTGDIITAVDDYKVTSIDTLYQALRPYRAGDTAEITVYRKGQTLTLSITFDTKAETDVTTEEPTEEETLPFEFPWDFFS